ncbi:MAG TPA: sulfotransferase [Verrucomicrobiales bacterium]|nr:sulfotransferase [Verrucomicrobiales bacterium]
MQTATERAAVCLLSPMRSGSTLLKALLAVADDVSNLPEVDFQRYGAGRGAEVFSLCRERIVVLKRPCWFHEVRRYPRLGDFASGRHVVLVRDALETVQSLKSMMFGPGAKWLGPWCDRILLERYWAVVTKRLAGLSHRQDNVCLVRYEDLVRAPAPETARVFRHIGSERSEGADRYGAPEGYRWRWGSDDGGEMIRTLRVQPARKRRDDPALRKRIERSAPVRECRRLLGYAACGETAEGAGARPSTAS